MVACAKPICSTRSPQTQVPVFSICSKIAMRAGCESKRAYEARRFCCSVKIFDLVAPIVILQYYDNKIKSNRICTFFQSFPPLKALLPIKSHSSRLPGKNFLEFAGKPLLIHVLEKLCACKELSQVVVNTDSDRVIEICSEYSKVQIIARPESLVGNEITMNSLIEYDLAQVEGEHWLQTHATNPLLQLRSIKNAIEFYLGHLDEYDSLLSVDSVKKRVYDKELNGVNHFGAQLVNTQDLDPVFIENSNLFLFSRSSFMKTKSRIGSCPYPFPLSPHESIDIDYIEDFHTAELIYNSKEKFGLSD